MFTKQLKPKDRFALAHPSLSLTTKKVEHQMNENNTTLLRLLLILHKYFLFL